MSEQWLHTAFFSEQKQEDTAYLHTDIKDVAPPLTPRGM